MIGSETPQPGWWRANDGRWYPPESLPAGWFIDAATATPRIPPLPPVPPRSKLAAPSPREPLLTRTPTFALDSAPKKALPTRAWRRYLGWPLWAKISAPIAVLALAGCMPDSSSGNGEAKVDTNGSSVTVISTTTVPAATTATSTTTRATTSSPTTATTTTRPPTTTTTTRPPTTTAAPQPPPPPPATATCTASMSNASPRRGAVVTVSVASSLPNSPIAIVAHYKTKDSYFSGVTGANGAGSVSFDTGGPTIGYTVVVNVTVGAITRCSTSFTPI